MRSRLSCVMAGYFAARSTQRDNNSRYLNERYLVGEQNQYSLILWLFCADCIEPHHQVSIFYRNLAMNPKVIFLCKLDLVNAGTCVSSVCVALTVGLFF